MEVGVSKMQVNPLQLSDFIGIGSLIFFPITSLQKTSYPPFSQKSEMEIKEEPKKIRVSTSKPPKVDVSLNPSSSLFLVNLFLFPCYYFN